MKPIAILSLLSLIFIQSIHAQSYSEMGRFNSQGVPDYLDPNREVISQALLEDLNILLPNGESLPQNNPDFYNRNTMKAITINQSGDVYMAFVSEGADFKSAVGFYTYQGDPPARAFMLNNLKIVFPNVSGVNSGGGLHQGDRVKLGTFPAGTSIGFFLIANGFRFGRVMRYGNDVFFTDPQYNPESNSALKKHAVLLFDDESDRYVLMFEDFNRSGGSDHDFNDAVFVISSGASQTFSTEGAVVVQKEKEILQGVPEVGEITICHFPPGNQGNPVTITISENAWEAHQAHGDLIGGCDESLQMEGSEDKTEFDINGYWSLSGYNQVNLVLISPNGIYVKSNKSPAWFIYQETNVYTYKDDKGNTYRFFPDGTGEWMSSNGKTIIKLTRVPGFPDKEPSITAEMPDQQTDEVKKITICHYPPGNPDNPQEIMIPETAWSVHEAHGDVPGSCDGGDSDQDNLQRRITICHYPPGNPNNPREISIPEVAWPVHEAHGDVKGSCDGSDSESDNENKKITICHYPPGKPNNPQEISISESAWKAHEAHGDVKGKCN